MSAICIWIREHYERTDSGKSWKSKPTDTERLIISDEWQRNQTSDESAHFWNAFGTCRRSYGYTYAGYRVTSMTLTSPDRERQTREFFRFVPIDMGYREHDIISAARTAELRTVAINGEPHDIARFAALDTFCDIDITARRVVG